MKILDIILEDQFVTTRSEKQYHGTLKAQHRQRTHELSRGTQAAVKLDKTDPHMVDKYNHQTYGDDKPPLRRFPKRKDDGFNQFINYLIDHKLMGTNTHFPRVYDVTTITDKTGRRIHTYTVEKLVESTDVSKPELAAVIEHQFNPRVFALEPDQMEQFPDPENEDEWCVAYMKRIATKLGDCVKYASTAEESIKSETLLAAIKILKAMDKEFPQQMDIHAANIMWRRGPSGLVLVFNDPVF